MASASIQLTLPRSCPEPWQAMTPDQQGRFCAHCQKTVVDFTAMTDAQVLAHLRATAGTPGCGRLRADQLDRVLTAPAAGKPGRWQWLGVLLSGWLSSQVVQAQTEAVTDRRVGGTFIPARATTNTGTTSPDTASQGLMTDGIVILTGRIIDATSRCPIAGAAVFFKKNFQETTTDSAGRFRLTDPAIGLDSTVQVVVAMIGYASQERIVSLSAINQPLQFELREDFEALAGEVVVVKKPMLWRRIRNLFRRG